METYRDLRPRGVVVYPMPETVGGPRFYGSYALMVRCDGTRDEVRMVHYEGVQYAVTDDKPWRWSDYHDEVHAWSPASLMLVATQSKPVDLADWVADRNKDRLEVNFNLAFSWAVQ